MKKVCIVVSSEMTVKAFLLDQIAALSRVYKVSVVANTRERNFLKNLGIEVAVLPIPIDRNISLWQDAYALFLLFRIFRGNGFDLVHSVTPKAGLLSMLGGTMARIPFRIHTFTGQVWVTRAGAMSWLLKIMDRIISFFSTHILVDGALQYRFLLEEKVVSPEKARVLANGSLGGVDTVRFRPDAGMRAEVRRGRNIPGKTIVFLYLGRLNRDKGLLDFAEAYSRTSGDGSQVYWLIVGGDEENIRPQILNICASCSDSIHFTGYTDTPERYLAASDVLCLPSYREGFNSVIIEAASAGIPAIASRIYGITDAVEDGVTGLLHDPGDAGQIADRMKRMIADPQMREKMGRQAHERALREFPKEKVTSALLDYYRTIMD